MPTPGRKPAQTPESRELVLSGVEELTSSANELALVHSQQSAHVRAVAAKIGYALPADATDPDLIQRDISANMRRSVEACLEVGRGLACLKAACQHGEFTARLDVLGIDVHVAARFMQSAAKFGKLPTSATLSAIGNQSKLFEMLVLDDEQVEELALTGQTGELSLDDVATMSVKELRAALRELKAETAAHEEVLAKKNARIDALEREKKRVAKLPPDETLKAVMAEATHHALDALGAVRGGVRQALVALNDLPDDPSKGVFMAGLVGQLQAELASLREEFNLPDVSNAADAVLAAEVNQWAGPAS